MSKHITDHERDRTEGERARNYVKIKREHGSDPHETTQTLQRRPVTGTTDNNSLRAFTRIERGQKA